MMRALISMLIVAAAAVVGLCSVAPAASPREEPQIVLGGWKPIKNVNDPHIQDLGRWAVLEHNKEASDVLVFSKVVSGEEQVVDGENYNLVLQATNGTAGNNATYGAVVYEKVDKTRQLLSFVPAN